MRAQRAKVVHDRINQRGKWGDGAHARAFEVRILYFGGLPVTVHVRIPILWLRGLGVYNRRIIHPRLWFGLLWIILTASTPTVRATVTWLEGATWVHLAYGDREKCVGRACPLKSRARGEIADGVRVTL
jgi:hypothetical protein